MQSPRARYPEQSAQRIGVSLPPRLLEYLRIRAVRENRSVSNMLAVMVEWYERQHPER